MLRVGYWIGGYGTKTPVGAYVLLKGEHVAKFTTSRHRTNAVDSQLSLTWQLIPKIDCASTSRVLSWMHVRHLAFLTPEALIGLIYLLTTVDNFNAIALRFENSVQQASASNAAMNALATKDPDDVRMHRGMATLIEQEIKFHVFEPLHELLVLRYGE